MNNDDNFGFAYNRISATIGRASQEQLTDEMRRTLDDPCVKVVLEAVTGFVLILGNHPKAANDNHLKTGQQES